MTEIEKDPLSAPKCSVCKKALEIDNSERYGCPACTQRYPPSLLKACCDEFEYVCRLSTGETIYFTKATISGDYCTLDGLDPSKQLSDNKQQLPNPFPRGLDVRLSGIVWCADAPNGF